MRETIARLVEGDDSAFEVLMKAICAGKIHVLGRREADGHTLTFANYVIDDMDYIPLFSDEKELNEFRFFGDSEEWDDLEVDGSLLATTMTDEQFLMINPVSGGIMFQGDHLKSFIDPADLS